jgi:hypothetical protein
MSKDTKVVDGADRRKVRLLDLLSFIHTNAGATSNQIMAYMTVKYGLRRETTAQYIQDLDLARLIMRGGPNQVDKWFTTGNYKKLALQLYGDE